MVLRQFEGQSSCIRSILTFGISLKYAQAFGSSSVARRIGCRAIGIFRRASACLSVRRSVEFRH